MRNILIAGALLVILGLVGTADMRQSNLEASSDLQHQMANVCHQSYETRSGSLERACGDLIDRVQAGNHYEVLNDGLGNFWAESK